MSRQHLIKYSCWDCNSLMTINIMLRFSICSHLRNCFHGLLMMLPPMQSDDMSSFTISWKEIISLFNAKSWDGLSKGFWLIGLACSSFSRKKTKTVYMEKIKLLIFTENSFWADFKYSIKYHSDLLESIIQKSSIIWYYILKSVESKAWRYYYLIPYCLLITNTWIRSLDRLVKILVKGLIIKRKLI